MTASERLYYDDSYTVRFDGDVVDVGTHEDRPAVELRRTYFYPESGGQLADRGTLGGVPVVDVQAGADGRVWHVLDLANHDVPQGAVGCVIDWSRRFDFMQQHTGQHVLSAAFERVLGAVTLSSRLGETHSTIELDAGEADWRAVERVERAANAVLWEDRPVERHWVDEKGLARFQLRKAPAVTGRIRIVEIPDWDASACGGTHVRRTGEVGIIKVIGWEKVRGHVRYEFVCGERALSDHAWRTEALTEAAKRRTLKDRDLIEYLERVAAERDQLKKELLALRTDVISREARERVGDPPKPVTELAEGRAREELRTFVIKCLEAGAPWVVAATVSPDPAIIVGRAKSLDANLRSLVAGLSERSGGKGGGSADLVQVAAEDAAGAEGAFRWALDEVRELLGEKKKKKPAARTAKQG